MIPAATSTTPTRITSSGIASGRSAGATFCSAEPAASAAADVVVITIIRVLELSPPATGPTKLAYSPCTGLTPARTAAAIPSGTLLIAPGSPATMSARRWDRSGPMPRSQRPTAATGERIACIIRLLHPAAPRRTTGGLSADAVHMICDPGPGQPHPSGVVPHRVRAHTVPVEGAARVRSTRRMSTMSSSAGAAAKDRAPGPARNAARNRARHQPGTMAWIPGGTFLMGSAGFYPEERPVHRVTIDGFWMDARPLTLAEFRRFVTATGYVTVAERPLDAADYPDADRALPGPGSLAFRRTPGPGGLRAYPKLWA